MTPELARALELHFSILADEEAIRALHENMAEHSEQPSRTLNVLKSEACFRLLAHMIAHCLQTSQRPVANRCRWISQTVSTP
jgi:hypothetical protein